MCLYVCIRPDRHIRYHHAACVESHILRSSPDADQKVGSAELISCWLFHIPFHPPPPTILLPPSRRPAPLLRSEDCGRGNFQFCFDHLFSWVRSTGGTSRQTGPGRTWSGFWGVWLISSFITSGGGILPLKLRKLFISWTCWNKSSVSWLVTV